MEIALFLLLLPIITLSAALPTSSTPLPPKQDPWYTAPSDFESALPGEILRIRNAPGNLTTIFSNSSAAYNILYRSTDSNYQPAWAVTTLFVPKRTNSSALLSYQIPYNSVDLDTGPSYALYTPPTPLSALTNSDIQTALSFGFWVNIPDFEGPLTAFTNGIQSGYAVLDSIRAAKNAGFGLSDNARYAMWGYSGGSIASEWAAELQSQYAPELEFAGAALGGLVSNVSSVFPVITGTRWAALIPEALMGITAQSPEARQYLLSQLKTDGPFNQTGFLAVQNISIAEAFIVFAGQDIDEYFRDGQEVFNSPLIQTLLNREGQMGFHGIPEMPLLVYKAIADELTHIDDTDLLIDSYCSVGANIVYERNTVGGHLAEMTNGDQRALQWLKTVLQGDYQHEGCTIRNVTLNVDDSPL